MCVGPPPSYGSKLRNSIERVSIKGCKTKTKVITLANQKGRRHPVNQSKLKVITRSRHKARENVHARATDGFGFTSDWLKKWRENFEPIKGSDAKPKQFANYFRHSIENRSIILFLATVDSPSSPKLDPCATGAVC